MQLLVFAGILAFSRARVHDDWFFSSVAALLLTLAFFTHLTGILAIGAVGAAALLGWFDRRAPPLAFLLPVTAGAALAALYFLTVLAPYIEAPIRFFRGRPHLIFWAAGFVTVLGILWTQRQRLALTGIRVWLPRVTAVVVLVLAGYAYLFREPVGRLALHDAHALRDFVQFYLTPVGLVAALAGLVLLLRKAFWPASAFVLTLLVFSCVFFYKIRVIPEHFWAARRFLSVILPASCLLIGTAAFPSSMVRLPTMLERRWARGLAYALGVGLVVVIGHRYFQATRPILTHVEYAGVIPQLETLNTQLQDTDLILVESRQASDVHTLALPLAYIYGRRVLIFSLANPDKTMLSEFLSWARGRHGRVLFLGGGGSQLLSRSTTATRLSAARFDIPEYESSYQAYPREVRLKRYDLALYELLPRLTPPQGFELDIGVEDELFLRRFFPQEVLGERGATFRWTADTVFVSLIGIDPEHRTLTLWLNNGGRPTNLSPPTVEVTLDEVELGTVTVTSSFEPYQFEIPLDLATRLQTSEEAGQLQLVTPTWNPGAVLGVDDPRDLGVMVDRITVGP